jgi:transcriptional regulator with XRE-family HTH domain
MLSMARRRAGLSQRELARRADVPQATISRIERAVVSPRVDTLDPLIRACGMQLEAIEGEGIGVDRSTFPEMLRKTPAQRASHATGATEALRRLRHRVNIPEGAGRGA